MFYFKYLPKQQNLKFKLWIGFIQELLIKFIAQNHLKKKYSTAQNNIFY